MRTNLLNDLSNVLKKGTSLGEKGTSLAGCAWSQVGRMSEEATIEHPLSIHSASIGRGWTKMWRYAAMVTLLLTLACGNAWGA